ncbi:MAG: nitrate ABC transporter permease [Actinobacteria bacterium]|nr:nitrate ABC transporter permease [Actinomycetota bacterium]
MSERDLKTSFDALPGRVDGAAVLDPSTGIEHGDTAPPSGTAGAAGRPRRVAGLRRPASARARSAVDQVVLGFAGFVGLFALWAAIAAVSPDLPTPAESLSALSDLLAEPFHDNGPNDKGIGIQLMTSLQRVFIGFALALVVAIPVGFAMGASRQAWSAFNPVVQLLRPVSPLAWFPLGLVVLKAAPAAAIFVIFITSIWPTLLNTAFGVASVPESHKNVARVFRFSKFKYTRHVLLPYSLPSMVTGMRISMGIAWMVIVAAEMLSGGTGIGFFVWDAYNASNLANVAAAIFLIGIVGVALDFAFGKLQARVQYKEVV